MSIESRQGLKSPRLTDWEIDWDESEGTPIAETSPPPADLRLPAAVRAKLAYHRVMRAVRENPLPMIGAALAVGLLVGRGARGTRLQRIVGVIARPLLSGALSRLFTALRAA